MNDYFDVWLLFLDDDSEDAHAEANTRTTEYGYAIDWYLTDVGMVKTVEFDTLADAYDWYESNGFQNFTS